MNTIGERLKKGRLATNLSIVEVSDKTGISRGNLSRLENDVNKPSSEALILLSDLYDVSVDWILKGQEYTVVSKKNQNEIMVVEDKRLRAFLERINRLWAEGNRDVRGWIIIQLSKAFPEIAEELKKENENAATAETA
ncbi:helix-turn-helix protein [Hydrogenispora ethanolica]|jgi:transcriptional regulator with XRE-family HTH domain|uniref:Helix-turn-helix protein n=1 Tax=Hydrogenispora ethanolica TaxID=1082276 RepID=A0A4R1SC43_HYDET|nr:helix-turn-helix transcriptional regulator [Hydrogenispora ethanolica]TCL77009.1 helix-turn-helix protein [Hydrogenispora ethanolica]